MVVSEIILKKNNNKTKNTDASVNNIQTDNKFNFW